MQFIRNSNVQELVNIDTKQILNLILFCYCSHCLPCDMTGASNH